MPKFVIEREIPGAGKLSGQELHAISQKSCGVLQTMGPKIQWLHYAENRLAPLCRKRSGFIDAGG